MKQFKTYSQSQSTVEHKWILVDAGDAPIGRLSTFIAQRLTGKYKSTYTPSIDDGDFVVVINANNAVVTGNKAEDKKYYSYSGYPSGLKTTTFTQEKTKDATKLVEHSVKGMLPKNKLQAERMKRLRVFATDEHTHGPQQPQKVEVK